MLMLVSACVYLWARRDRTAMERETAEIVARNQRLKNHSPDAPGPLNQLDEGDGRAGTARRRHLEKSEQAKWEAAADAQIAAKRERFWERMANDPDFQNRYVAFQRQEKLDLYRPFFRARNLSTEQIERLGDAWARSAMASFDLLAVRKNQRLSHNDSVMMKLSQEASAGALAEETAVLGEAGVAKLRQWEKTIMTRSIVSGFAGRAVLANAPVDLDQVEKLVAIMEGSGPGAKTGRYSQERVDWGIASEAARDVLTPVQHGLFAVEMERQRTRGEFRRAISEARRSQAEARMKDQASGTGR